MAKNSYNLWIGILVICLIVLISLLLFIEMNSSPQPSSEELELSKIRECINKTHLKLYGKENSQIFLAQKEELGKIFDFVPFVDCNTNREECVGVLLIPAWEINDQIYYGSFSRDVLIKLMECD